MNSLLLKVLPLLLVIPACFDAGGRADGSSDEPLASCTRTPIAASFCERAPGVVGLTCDMNPDVRTCGRSSLAGVWCCSEEPAHAELEIEASPGVYGWCEADSAVFEHCSAIGSTEALRCDENPDPHRCAALSEDALPEAARRSDRPTAYCCSP